MANKKRQGPAADRLETADALHSAAITLLRRVRAEDRLTELTGPRLSALSVIVFAGPITITELAKAEQVRLPTISRLITDLKHDGLIRRMTDRDDRRVRRVAATRKGRTLLKQGRDRRVRRLAEDLKGLSDRDQRTLARAAGILKNLPTGGDNS